MVVGSGHIAATDCKNIFTRHAFYIGPLMPLFWTSSDICPRFQSRGGSPHSLHHLHVMNSSDLLLMQHLLTTWQLALHRVFLICVLFSSSQPFQLNSKPGILANCRFKPVARVNKHDALQYFTPKVNIFVFTMQLMNGPPHQWCWHVLMVLISLL